MYDSEDDGSVNVQPPTSPRHADVLYDYKITGSPYEDLSFADVHIFDPCDPYDLDFDEPWAFESSLNSGFEQHFHTDAQRRTRSDSGSATRCRGSRSKDLRFDPYALSLLFPRDDEFDFSGSLTAAAAAAGETRSQNDEVGGRPQMTVLRPNVTTGQTANASQRRRKHEAKFACPVPWCEGRFTRAFNLKRHMRSHNEEKPSHLQLECDDELDFSKSLTAAAAAATATGEFGSQNDGPVSGGAEAVSTLHSNEGSSYVNIDLQSPDHDPSLSRTDFRSYISPQHSKTRESATSSSTRPVVYRPPDTSKAAYAWHESSVVKWDEGSITEHTLSSQPQQPNTFNPVQKGIREISTFPPHVDCRQAESPAGQVIPETPIPSISPLIGDLPARPRTALMSDEQQKVTTMLRTVLKTVPLYKHLLSYKGVNAQKILDGFQLFSIGKLLDTGTFPDRGELIVAMRRLSGQTQLYPSRFFLQLPSPSVEDEPVTSGGFADIYKIEFSGQKLCYKVIRIYQKSRVEHLAKVYAREAILWGQLSHSNILPFYGLLKFRSRISFVSCWASNGNLNDYLAEHPEANRILLCSDTAAGVEYLHENDIVHGDLKGLNVLIDSSGRASLGDFGVSSVADPQILEWTSQLTMASKGGTVRWQAPELLSSEDTTTKVCNSKASDVFAWASVCYEIFTGRLPFHEAPIPGNVILSIMQGNTPTRPQDDDPAWMKHGLNDSIWDLMKDCWNFEPSKRPTMTAIISRLDPEKPVDLRPVGEWAKTAMQFRNAQDEASSRDLMPSLEELESLLSHIVPG